MKGVKRAGEMHGDVPCDRIQTELQSSGLDG